MGVRKFISFLQSVFTILTILFISSGNELKSQEHIECVKLFRSTDSQFSFKYAGHDSNYIYWHTTINRKDILHIKVASIENQNMHVEKEVLLPRHYLDADILKIRMNNGETTIISSIFDKKERKQCIYREVIDIQFGYTKGNIQKIAEIATTDKKTNLRIVESQDRSHYAIFIYRLKGFEFTDAHLFVLNEDLSLKYNLNLLENLLGFQSINELVVDNTGQVYLMIMNFESLDVAKAYMNINSPIRKGIDNQTPQYTYQILFTDNNGSSSKHHISAPKGKLIRFTSVYIDDTSKVICGAMSNSGSLYNSDLFCYKIDKSLPNTLEISDVIGISEKSKRKYNEDSDRELYEKAKESKKRDYSLTNRGIIKFNEGYIIFLEQTFVFTYSAQNFNAGAITYTAIIDDCVYGVYTDSLFRIQNIFSIPKEQSKNIYPASKNTHITPSFMSSYWVENDQLFYLFSTDYHLQRKMEKSICYIYDKDFKMSTVEIPSIGEFEKGFTTNNIWVNDSILIGDGIDRPILQTTNVFLIRPKIAK